MRVLNETNEQTNGMNEANEAHNCVKVYNRPKLNWLFSFLVTVFRSGSAFIYTLMKIIDFAKAPRHRNSPISQDNLYGEMLGRRKKWEQIHLLIPAKRSTK